MADTNLPIVETWTPKFAVGDKITFETEYTISSVDVEGKMYKYMDADGAEQTLDGAAVDDRATKVEVPAELPETYGGRRRRHYSRKGRRGSRRGSRKSRRGSRKNGRK